MLYTIKNVIFYPKHQEKEEKLDAEVGDLRGGAAAHDFCIYTAIPDIQGRQYPRQGDSGRQADGRQFSSEGCVRGLQLFAGSQILPLGRGQGQ